MEQQKINWVAQTEILKSWFENDTGQRASNTIYNETEFEQNFQNATGVSLVLGLDGSSSQNYKFSPFFRFTYDSGEPLDLQDQGLEGFNLTTEDLIEEINNSYQRPRAIRPGMGESDFFMLFNQLRWSRDFEEAQGDLTDVFTTREQDRRDSREVRLISYTVPENLLQLWKEHISQIRSVRLMFGLEYGRVPGISLMFNPIIRLDSEVGNIRIEERIQALNKLSNSYAIKGAVEDEITLFNFLRPCPPFGDCDENGSGNL